MGLAALQSAAARLSTDASARRLLLADPGAFARDTDLSPDEVRTLVELAAGFEKFARSLLAKRVHEAARAVPLSVEALGADFRPLFETFAAEQPVARDPACDALAFLDWLRRRRKGSAAARGVARYERASLGFGMSNRRVKLAIFYFRERRPRFLPRLCGAVWWRFGGRRRYLQWPRSSSRRTAL